MFNYIYIYVHTRIYILYPRKFLLYLSFLNVLFSPLLSHTSLSISLSLVLSELYPHTQTPSVRTYTHRREIGPQWWVVWLKSDEISSLTPFESKKRIVYYLKKLQYKIKCKKRVDFFKINFLNLIVIINWSGKAWLS